MRDAYDQIETAGLRVVVIGNGSAPQAKLFRAEERLPFPLWVDPEMEAYAAAGLRRGIAKSVSLKSVGHAFRAWRGGHRQSKVAGDPWQLGGTFVIDSGGEVLYAHASREAGDHAPLDEALVAAR